MQNLNLFDKYFPQTKSMKHGKKIGTFQPIIIMLKVILHYVKNM